MDLHWSRISVSEHSFLRVLTPLFESGYAESLMLEPPGAGAGFSRLSCDGLVTLRGEAAGRLFGVVMNDFRVGGGSYGKDNTLRLVAFLRHMRTLRAPVVFCVNSLGVRIMEGRTVFAATFQLIPELLAFSRAAPLITYACGKCLGLGAVAFGMGHYRIAVRGESLINLTGPEVLSLFFGHRFDFPGIASAEHQFEKNYLVQEVLPDPPSALARICEVLNSMAGQGSGLRPEADGKLVRLLSLVGEPQAELFGQMSRIVRVFLVRNENRLLGVLINPPGHPNNLITCEALEKYSAALTFFDALQVPVVSLLDTPGADPRAEGSNQNVIASLIRLAGQIIDYPHGKMGVNAGRAFGGATVLGLPKVLGARRAVALRGCRAGIMDEAILKHLLSGSTRLAAEWERTASTQTPDLADMLAAGIFDAVIDEEDLPVHVGEFLSGLEPPPLSGPQESLGHARSLKARRARSTRRTRLPRRARRADRHAGES